MLINIPEYIAQRLEKLAQQKGSSVSDVLENLLDRYAQETPPGSLAELAQNARDAGIASAQTVDTAKNSRDILNSEYADYLKNRIGTDANDDHNG